jgi:hypothetical protein
MPVWLSNALAFMLIFAAYMTPSSILRQAGVSSSR